MTYMLLLCLQQGDKSAIGIFMSINNALRVLTSKVPSEAEGFW